MRDKKLKIYICLSVGGSDGVKKLIDSERDRREIVKERGIERVERKGEMLHCVCV